MVRTRVRRARATLAVAATVAVVTGAVSAVSSGAATPRVDNLAAGIATHSHASLLAAAKRAGATPRVLANRNLPPGVPSEGTFAFLLKLSPTPTMRAYNRARAKGTRAAQSAAQAQLSSIKTAQNNVIAALPSQSTVLYRTHAVLSGVAVTTDVHNYAALTAMHGVTAVYPIAPKSASNSYAVPLQRAPQAWQAFGDLGANSTVAVIDTGVDYTHANFGGPGTVDAYRAAKAQAGKPTVAGEFPGKKVIGGFDFAGDAYDATASDPTFNPVPTPDPYPLDCDGHGSHVAGTVAGYGENADGSTYTGRYNTKTPFSTMRIGPGIAPKAKLYAFRVFGCAGSSNLISAAIDRAADPNNDGSTSDHADVINMSLGSDFGSPQDGDSVLADAASQLGISVVVASGNAGDLYDVGGSPGDAPRTIAAAASADAYSQTDALNVTAPAAIAGSYAAERSAAFDYSTGDLAGPVARVSDPANLDGCDPLSAADAAAVKDKIAFVEWTDDDINRRCGSVARGGNIAAAGASGFIYADDEESFAAGITGDATIPGVLVSKSGGDAIRTQLLAGQPVTIGSTTSNSFRQLIPSLNDTVAGFSSRGIGDPGNVKPDVTAVGVSVFSTGSGTGNQGLNDSGTSMATPMVAGTAALVTSLHPNWTPEQTKADIMNTADQDLFLGPDHTGVKFAPNRVGAGRIDVQQALRNKVLAYVTDDPGSVSASFGTLAVTEHTRLTKTIRVQNTELRARTYAVSYLARTSVPGASYTVSPSTVTVGARSSTFVTLTLTIDPGKLTKTIDPTVDAIQGVPREFLADASGLVMFTSRNAPSLRVPVYSAPRPASVMSQPSTLKLPRGAVQQAVLHLSGKRVNQGTGAATVQSIVAGFELSATSGLAPACSNTVTSGCVSFPDERAADLKYVGVTSDAPQVSSIGADPAKDGLAYFAVSTQGPWRAPAGIQEFDVLIDVDGDGTADLVMFNTRIPAATSNTDVMIDETVDLRTGAVVDAQGINDRLGDTDTALFNSDTLVMPVAIAALGLGAKSRISYGVEAFSGYQAGPIDSVGLNPDGNPTGSLSFDPLHPGVAVFGSFDGDASALLFRDSPGSVLVLRRDSVAYAADHGLGALVVHFHNTVGNKAQVVRLTSDRRRTT